MKIKISNYINKYSKNLKEKYSKCIALYNIEFSDDLALDVAFKELAEAMVKDYEKSSYLFTPRIDYDITKLRSEMEDNVKVTKYHLDYKKKLSREYNLSDFDDNPFNFYPGTEPYDTFTKLEIDNLFRLESEEYKSFIESRTTGKIIALNFIIFIQSQKS